MLPSTVLHQPLLWVFVPLAVYAIVINLLWVVDATPGRYRALRGLADLARVPLVRWLARGVYLLGIPALAVALRVPGLTAGHLGLPARLGAPGSGSLEPAAMAIALGLATLAAILGAQVWYHLASGQPSPLAPARLSVTVLGWLALTALLLEAHWALVRAAMLTLDLGSAIILVYLSLVVLGLEAWVSPWRRSRLLDPAGAAALSRTGALAVQSALVFLITDSSVLCLLAHLGVTWTTGSLLPEHRDAAAGGLDPDGGLAPAEPASG
jgi:hypothetical protein